MPAARRLTSAALLAAIAGACLSNRAHSRPDGALFPAAISLATLDGSNGFRLDGAAANDFSGFSVTSAGDVNGDGVGDLIIGAYAASPGGASSVGSTYVVFGKDANMAGAFPAALALAALNGSDGFRLDGVAPNDRSGVSVAAAGDVNGDGVGDLIIGAYRSDPGGRTNAGSSYVVFGRDTSAAGAFPATLSLASLDGATGFRLEGAAEGDSSGWSVAPAGDVNGDGVSDLVIGAYAADPGGNNIAGSTYVVFGKDTTIAGPFPAALNLASLDGASGFRLDGAAAGDRSGWSVASAGDVNGDGVDDVVLGALVADPGGVSSAGSTYVVFGRDTSVAGQFPATLNLASLDGAAGFRLDGATVGELSGGSVASAGDINGDGVGDLVIGAYGADPGGASSAGSTYVVFGKDTGAAGVFPAALALSSLDGAIGFRLDGVTMGDRSGFSVAPAGDVNGDGVADLVIGAGRADPGGTLSAGSTYVVFGRDTSAAGLFPAALALSSLDGATGFRLDGVSAFDFSGYSVASAGDVNGDGVGDLIIGAREADPGGALSAGSTYIVYGRSDTPPPCPGDANGDNVVDFLDLNIVLSDFGMIGAPGSLQGDLDDDGDCDFIDLNIVLSAFGTAC